MHAVEVGGRHKRDEELTAVAVGIELPDSNKIYFTRWTAALYLGESADNIYYMRHPTVACID